MNQSRSIKKTFHTLLIVAFPLAGGAVARATTIASDQVLTSATAGFYNVGNLNTQANLVGTTGYYTGTSNTNQVAGWNSGTGAFNAQVGGLTHPLVVQRPDLQ